jgi:hypothetical protein
MHPKFFALLICSLAMVSTGCVTHISPTVQTNPPPTERFGNFNHFVLASVDMPAEYDGDNNNQRAARKIQQNLVTGLLTKLEGWESKAAVARTLKIEPRIVKIKFVSIGDRVMFGAMPGSSAVLIKVRYTDAATGKVVAEPEFYQRSGATTHGFGVSDNLMLDNVANLIVRYTANNYDSAVGGPVSAP